MTPWPTRKSADLHFAKNERSELFDEYPNPAAACPAAGPSQSKSECSPNAATANPEPAESGRSWHEPDGSGRSSKNQREQTAARRKVQEYMMDNRLQRPQQLLQELISNRVVRGVYSERQLQEVMTDFWFNHFNVYWDKGADRWLTTDYEMNVIRPRDWASSKTCCWRRRRVRRCSSIWTTTFRRLQLRSRRRRCGKRANNANAKRKPGINENYARELMELHTLGVDGGYTQKDVTEVARALTGWTIDQPRMNASFIFRPQMHDRGEKIVLGHASRPMAEFRMGSTSSTSWPIIRARHVSSRRSWCAGSSATIRRSPLSTRLRQRTRRRMATSAKCYAPSSTPKNSCRPLPTGRK